MNNTIDLHIHSTFSDGKLTPIEILNKANKIGLKTVAISDHDSIMAYSPTLFNYAKKMGIRLIPAIEISTSYKSVSVHVLGYNIDYKNNELREALEKLQNARRDYAVEVCKKLGEFNFQSDINKLTEFGSITKSIIAEQIIDNPKNKENLINYFHHIPSISEFIETLMNYGCPAFIKKFSISPSMACQLIHNAGGKVILAHPVAYIYEGKLTVEEIIELVHSMNADGIESYYLYYDKDNRLHNDIGFWSNIATSNNWLQTLGSDYHKSDKYNIEMGMTNAKLLIDKKVQDDIINGLDKI